MMFNKRY